MLSDIVWYPAGTSRKPTILCIVPYKRIAKYAYKICMWSYKVIGLIIPGDIFLEIMMYHQL